MQREQKTEQRGNNLIFQCQQLERHFFTVFLTHASVRMPFVFNCLQVACISMSAVPRCIFIELCYEVRVKPKSWIQGLAPKSWIQEFGTKILNLRFWHQNPEFKILERAKILHLGFWPSNIVNSEFWNSEILNSKFWKSLTLTLCHNSTKITLVLVDLVHFLYNRIYNKMLDCDWFSARLFAT